MKRELTIVYQYFGTKDSGWSTRWYDFTQCIGRSTDYDIRVITSNFYKSDLPKAKLVPKKVIVDGIEVFILPITEGNNIPFYKRVLNAGLFALWCGILILLRSSEHYIFSIGPITAAFPSLLVRNKSRVSLEFRDLWPEGGIEMGKVHPLIAPALLRTQGILVNRADDIIVCSPRQKHILSEKYPNKRFVVIEHGFDTNLLNRLNENNFDKNNFDVLNGKSYLLCVASLGFIHNPFQWLKLAHHLKSSASSYAIVLAGDGPLRLALEEDIKNQDLSEVLILLGQVEKSKMLILMKKAQGFLFGTLDNYVQNSSSPNKIYDYLIFNQPIYFTNKSHWMLSDSYQAIYIDLDSISSTEVEELFQNSINTVNKDYTRLSRCNQISKLW